MAERNSPAVTFPLHGAGVIAGLAIFIMILAAALLAMWLWQGAGNGSVWWLRLVVAVVLWSVSALAAWRLLKSLPCGQLRWSGKRWVYESASLTGMLCHPPQVVCDFGRGMALVWRTEQGRRVHMWVQRDWSADAWLDLRRAVYLPALSLRVTQSTGAIS